MRRRGPDALAIAFLLRKSFCSWVCPVGFLSELLARFGRWSFGRNYRFVASPYNRVADVKMGLAHPAERRRVRLVRALRPGVHGAPARILEGRHRERGVHRVPGLRRGVPQAGSARRVRGRAPSRAARVRRAASVALFLAGYIGARATGHWENAIGDAEYVERIQDIRSAEYGYPGLEGPGAPPLTPRGSRIMRR